MHLCTVVHTTYDAISLIVVITRISKLRAKLTLHLDAINLVAASNLAISYILLSSLATVNIKRLVFQGLQGNYIFSCNLS